MAQSTEIRYAALALALVENLDHVEWTYESVRDGETVGIIYYWDTEAAAQILPEGRDIKEYGESEETLGELLDICQEQRERENLDSAASSQRESLTAENPEESGQESADSPSAKTEQTTEESEEEAQIIGGADGPTLVWVMGRPDLRQ